ncbi:MAG: hypothetical protein WCH79_16210 [Planctomycetia bacterium]
MSIPTKEQILARAEQLAKETTPEDAAKLSAGLFRQRLTQAAMRHARTLDNPNAAPLFLQQVDRVVKDVELGAPEKAAIFAGFCGRALNSILRSLKIPFTREELEAAHYGSGIYRPVSKNHPVLKNHPGR